MPIAEELGVEDVSEIVTTLYGIEGERNSRGQLNFLCPVHEAGETGHHPSCDVDLETGIWNCWSCPAAGDIVDLGVVILSGMTFSWGKDKKNKQRMRQWMAERERIKKMLVPDDPDARMTIVQRRMRAARREIQSAEVVRSRKDIQVPSAGSYAFKVPKYLTDRGFTKETIKAWGIRYAREATLEKGDGTYFTLTHAICIPLYTADQKLVGWCYRATPKSDAWFQNVRYIYTPGVQDTLNQMWFGMHKVSENDREITVVEGAFDAIWCWQNGIPAVAILGSQVKQLTKIRGLMRFRKVTILTDRDQSGATTAYYLGKSLQERGVPCTVCLWPAWMLNRRGEQAKDAQDLCPLDLELVHARAIPFILWSQRNRQLAA